MWSKRKAPCPSPRAAQKTCNSSKVLVALWLAIPLPRRVEIIGKLGRVRSLSYSDGKHLEPPGVEERENPVDTV